MYPKESLEIIGKMMNDTRHNVMLDSRLPLLIWGWVSFAVSILIYIALKFTGDFRWNFAWLLILLIGLPLVKRFKSKEPIVITAISKSLVVIWKMLTRLIVCFSVLAFFIPFNVLGMILLILAIGSFITGELIRYSYLKYSSIPGFIMAALLWWLTSIEQILIFAAAMLIMMVLPAYKMKQDLSNNYDERT